MVPLGHIWVVVSRFFSLGMLLAAKEDRGPCGLPNLCMDDGQAFSYHSVTAGWPTMRDFIALWLESQGVPDQQHRSGTRSAANFRSPERSDSKFYNSKLIAGNRGSTCVTV